MLGLDLLALHLIGDFVLSNRWQARWKLTDGRWRTYHVAVYTLPFVPVAYLAAPDALSATNFLILLFCLHWLTDCTRFRSTLGDAIHWRFLSEERRLEEWREATRPTGEVGVYPDADPTLGRTSDSLPPNPWGPIPLMVDQALHVAQLAILGTWLLT